MNSFAKLCASIIGVLFVLAIISFISGTALLLFSECSSYDLGGSNCILKGFDVTSYANGLFFGSVGLIVLNSFISVFLFFVYLILKVATKKND